jgi:hypothetical protein
MNSSRLMKLVILYLFPFLHYLGFRYIGFNLTILKALYFVAIPLMTLYIANTLFQKKQSVLFNKMRTITLLIFISIITAFLFNGQSISLGYRATAPILGILFYFYLNKANFTIKEIECFIWINVCVYLFLWLYALSQAPIPIFTVDQDRQLNDDRGIFRIAIMNRACIMMALFYSVNRWIVIKKKIFLVLSILMFVLIVFMTVRQYIVISVFVVTFYLFKKIRYIWLYAIMGLLLLNFVSISIPKDSILGRLIELSERQAIDNKYGETNVRILEYEYYFLDFPQNVVTSLLGNGVPHSDSSYGLKESKLNDVKKYFRSDVGYANLYLLIGIIGVLVVFQLMYYSIKYKVNNEMVYAKMFMFYIALANIASAAFTFDILFVCIAVYLIDKSKLQMSLSNKELS